MPPVLPLWVSGPGFCVGLVLFAAGFIGGFGYLVFSSLTPAHNSKIWRGYGRKAQNGVL
ncbi:hypothetical protein BV22DRAFT_1036518 [Leucogyrophana mollusca]|uniref:Uncharacterized protein n=1 Tax=Leucogyrophana mollusca TaxID=85980 RepID=A0ACB8BDK0_9AGAM|nr:hypothetical protein BV22DRAFT_1036518 [Leucogyrophana mollusca]